MARIRGDKPGKFSVWEDTAAIHDDVNDHEASELGGLEQHETRLDDASGHEAERVRKGKHVVESGIWTASELEGLEQHETGPEDASDIMIIADSAEDTGSTIIPAATVSSRIKKYKKSKQRRSHPIDYIYEITEAITNIPCSQQGNTDESAELRARLTIESRNDSDDVTTLKSSRKRKAARRSSNKKQKALKTKEPQLNESEKSSCSPKDHIASRKLQDGKSKGSDERDGLGGSEPSGSGSGVGQHVAAAGELKGATGSEVDVARAAEPEVLVCTLNQNPADFLTSFESENFWRV